MTNQHVAASSTDIASESLIKVGILGGLTNVGSWSHRNFVTATRNSLNQSMPSSSKSLSVRIYLTRGKNQTVTRAKLEAHEHCLFIHGELKLMLQRAKGRIIVKIGPVIGSLHHWPACKPELSLHYTLIEANFEPSQVGH